MKRSAVIVALLSCAIATATSRAAEPSDAGETKSILRCTPASGDFRIAFETAGAAASQSYANSESFNADVLMTWSKSPGKNEDAMRTGTRVKHLHCGDVTIDVRDGFYNANPQGELGAADDFARLTVKRGANKLEVSLLEDSCSDASIPRAQAAWGDNPLQAIEGHKAADGNYKLTLFKSKCDDSGKAKPVTEVVTWR